MIAQNTRLAPDRFRRGWATIQYTEDLGNYCGWRGIILSTINGAKGQEYDLVCIDPDIAASKTPF